MRLRSMLMGTALALAILVTGNYGAIALGSLGGSAFPLTFISQPVTNPTDGFNQLLQIINAQTTGISTTYANTMLEPPAGADTSQAIFSTGIQGNPLMQLSHTDITVSTGLTSASLTTLIASEAGRTIYPAGGLTIMASGTAATATGIALECSDGTFIASWPIAALVDQVPVGIYVSSTVNKLGVPLSKGCTASTGLMLSNVGTNLGTTTHLYVNVPYTVQ